MTSAETIFARASGAGKAGVAVIRLSGPQAARILNQLIGKRIINRRATLVDVSDPATGEHIDTGLAILFEAPGSFTGETVAELQLHGSYAVEQALYEALSKAGARPAEPGEFTLRAFRAGKLDLAQVEALSDLLESETTLQRKQALGQLGGALSARADGWRKHLLGIMAPLEADIDFPDEGDVPAAVAARAGPAIRALRGELEAFLETAVSARIIREGVSVAVIGPPNAGKSSLVNALAGSDVAIVSEVAGTTRDIIETRLDIGGVVIRLADTAGLRGMTGDVIEQEGIRRATARAKDADFRIAVLDPSGEFVSRETLELLQAGDILIWSKADQNVAIPQNVVVEGTVCLKISSKTGSGMKALFDALANLAPVGGNPDGAALTRVRHVQAVEAAVTSLARAERMIGAAPELAAEDARLAARYLAGITGAVGVEDVLGEIFSNFCIGK